MMPSCPVAIVMQAILAAGVLPVYAQSAENVAIVINDSSPESQQIGEHYARTRALPASNVLKIQTLTYDAIERSVYVRAIEQPLADAIRRGKLQDRILYLVLTKGVPLRITGSTGMQGESSKC
jgi:uncharacterized protein (TIGR03790 family)